MAFNLYQYVIGLTQTWPKAMRTTGMDWILVDRAVAAAVREMVSPPSASQIYQMLKWRGISSNWNQLQHRLAIYRHQEGVFDSQRSIASDTPFDPAKMTESLLPISENYRYIVSVDGWDYKGKQQDAMVFSITSNDLMSQDQVLDTFYEQNVDNFDSDFVQWETLSFVGAEKRPPLR